MIEEAETYCYDISSETDAEVAAALEKSRGLTEAGVNVESWSLGMKYDAGRLAIPERTTFEAWLEIGVTLGHMERSVQWWIGDWLVFGERHFPDRYSQAIEATHYSYSTLSKAAYVARQIPPGDRKESLPFAHHAEVAALPEPDRRELLDEAEREGWNKYQLRAHVRREAAPKERQFTVPRCKVCGSLCDACYEANEYRETSPAQPAGGREGGG